MLPRAQRFAYSAASDGFSIGVVLWELATTACGGEGKAARSSPTSSARAGAPLHPRRRARLLRRLDHRLLEAGPGHAADLRPAAGLQRRRAAASTAGSSGPHSLLPEGAGCAATARKLCQASGHCRGTQAKSGASPADSRLCCAAGTGLGQVRALVHDRHSIHRCPCFLYTA